MNAILKRIILSIGLSLLIGTNVAYFQGYDKYYIMIPQSPKYETTKQTATDSKFKKFSNKEFEANKTMGVIFGLGSLGGFLTLSILIRYKVEK